MKTKLFKKITAIALCAITTMAVFSGCSNKTIQTPIVDDNPIVKEEKEVVELLRQDIMYVPEYPSLEDLNIKETIYLDIVISPSETVLPKKDKELEEVEKPSKNENVAVTDKVSTPPATEQEKPKVETEIQKVETPKVEVEQPKQPVVVDNGKKINPATATTYRVSVPNEYKVVIDKVMADYNSNDVHRTCVDIDINTDGLDLATLNMYFIETYFPYCYTHKIIYKQKDGSHYYAAKAIEENLNTNAQIKNDIRSITTGFSQGTEKEVLAQASAWVAKHLTYTKNTSSLKEALYSKKAICHGYALLFKALCNEMGIRCEYESGYYNGEYHAWNIVYLSNGTYGYDITLNDSASTTKWNAVELSTFKNTHKQENTNYYEKIFS